MKSTGRYPWKTLEHLFHGALALPADARRAWLDTQVPEAPELVTEVLELLANHDDDNDRVDRAISATAHDISTHEQHADGRRLGAYRIIRRLGQGGMGTVYLAERDDREYHQQVAIKLIRGFPGDEALARLRQERQILAELNHPHIARLLDGGSTEDGQPYLVMEYIDGTPVIEWCRKHRLDHTRRIRLMLDICDAVHYAHQHLVIHRDIKPGNVLVTADPDAESATGGRPVLLDFGIAKLVSAPGQETTQTARYYTPGYASPEQLAGRRITTAADIYSLGRLLLTLLEVEPESRIATGAEQPVFRRAAWTKHLPRDLAAVIDQATRDEPERRYPTASALRADLVNYLEGQPVDAVPSRIGYRLGKFVRRHQAAVLAAALAVLIALGLLWRLLVEYERARDAEATAVTEALRAEQTAEFLLNMLGSIDPEYADGADTRLMQRLLEDAAARAPVELEAQPPVLADIQYVIGRTFYAIGEFARAREHLIRAAELTRGTPHQPSHLRANNHLALVDAMTGDYTAGLARLESMLEQANPHLPPDDLYRLDAMHNQAHLLVLSGENRAAEPIIREIIDLTAGAAEPMAVNIRLESIRSLANIHQNLGRHEHSHQRLEQVRTEAEAWEDPSASRHIAAALNDQATMYLEQQRYAEAETLLRESLALHEQRYGADHPRLLQVLSNLASALRQQDRLDDARPVFERARGLALDAFGPDHPAALVVQYNFGNLLRVQGDTVQAVELQRAALEGAASAFPANHPAQGMFRLGLGQSELANGNAAAAAEYLEESVVLLREMRGPDHHRTVEAEQALAEARHLLADQH